MGSAEVSIPKEIGRSQLRLESSQADRPELEAQTDSEVLRSAAGDRRALVTNDVLDFQLLHNQLLAAGEEHYGIVFTDDVTMPRNKASIPLWIETLTALLEENESDDALRNRVRHLP